LAIIRKFPNDHQLRRRLTGGRSARAAKAYQPIRNRMGLLADSEMESRKGMSFVRMGRTL